MAHLKKNVLIFTAYYYPSIKAGGPVQSIKNLVDNLSDYFNFYIITSDRDLGDSQPFTDIKTEEWIDVGNAKVFYVDNKHLSLMKTSKIINDTPCKVMYLNSFFSLKHSIFPLILIKLKVIKMKKTILTPRGEFSIGALAIKKRKKQLFIGISKKMKLHKSIEWHATNEKEHKEITDIFSDSSNVTIINNLTPDYSKMSYTKEILKESGNLKIIYIARIHPIKNLLQIINLLNYVDGDIEFNIYGPIEDVRYWEKCEVAIRNLKKNIHIKYCGTIQHSKVIDIYNSHHISALLTLGENFGHSISEAMIGGCPVIISDKTPWRELEKNNVGFDIPLKDEKKIIDSLQYFVDMNNTDYQKISKKAFEYSQNKSNNNIDIETYKKIFC